jgi:hypothetical protein
VERSGGIDIGDWPRPDEEPEPSCGGGAVIGVLGGGLACCGGECSGVSAPPAPPEGLE